MRCRYSAWISGFEAIPDQISVGTKLGMMELTRIPCSPRSSAAQRVSMLIPALEAQYALIQRCESAPAMELTLTMLPPPLGFIARASARRLRNVPTRLVSTVLANSAAVA